MMMGPDGTVRLYTFSEGIQLRVPTERSAGRTASTYQWYAIGGQIVGAISVNVSDVTGHYIDAVEDGRNPDDASELVDFGDYDDTPYDFQIFAAIIRAIVAYHGDEWMVTSHCITASEDCGQMITITLRRHQ